MLSKPSIHFSSQRVVLGTTKKKEVCFVMTFRLCLCDGGDGGWSKKEILSNAMQLLTLRFVLHTDLLFSRTASISYMSFIDQQFL